MLQKFFLFKFWITFCFTNFPKDVAGKCNPRNTLSLFCWRKFVCFDLPVVGASSTLPDEKIVNKMSQQKRLKVFLGLHFPATSFTEILTIKIDQHEILNNFCYMTINSEECRSYHSTYPFLKWWFLLEWARSSACFKWIFKEYFWPKLKMS